MKRSILVILGFLTAIILSQGFDLPIEIELLIVAVIAAVIYVLDRYIISKSKQ